MKLGGGEGFRELKACVVKSLCVFASFAIKCTFTVACDV